jgi:predicted RecA/RadA family phage recombinase
MPRWGILLVIVIVLAVVVVAGWLFGAVFAVATSDSNAASAGERMAALPSSPKRYRH